MGARRVGAVILTVIVGGAMATLAEGQVAGTLGSVTTTVTASPPQTTPDPSRPPKSPTTERTHPQVQPTTGRRHTRFSLTFTLREAPGHQGIFAVEYRVQVTPPAGTRASCMPAELPAIDAGAVGTTEQLQLTPRAHGWCKGTYLATVFLQRGPYCPPPVEGEPPPPCPEFATQVLATGAASFMVRPKAHNRG